MQKHLEKVKHGEGQLTFCYSIS